MSTTLKYTIYSLQCISILGAKILLSNIHAPNNSAASVAHEFVSTNNDDLNKN